MRRSPATPTLDATVRGRLAAGLVALIERGPDAPGVVPSDGGWVRVRVTLAPERATAIRARVETLGGWVTRRDAKTLEATLTVAQLVALAGSEGVERIDAA